MLIYTSQGWQPFGLSMLTPTPAAPAAYVAVAREFVAHWNETRQGFNDLLAFSHRYGRRLDVLPLQPINLTAYGV